MPSVTQKKYFKEIVKTHIFVRLFEITHSLQIQESKNNKTKTNKQTKKRGVCICARKRIFLDVTAYSSQS